MKLSDFKSLQKEIDPLITGLPLISCIEGPEYYFTLTFGKYSLLISLKMPFLRFHLANIKRKSIPSQFASLLERHLKKMTLKSFTILNEDRILAFSFTNGKQLIVELFPKKPNLFLIDRENQIIGSYNPIEATTYIIPPQLSHDPSHSTISSEEIEKEYQQKEEDAAFQNKKQLILTAINKEIKQYTRQLKKAEEQLSLCLEWEKIQHQALLLQSYFHLLKKGEQSIRLLDWERNNEEVEIALDPKLDPPSQVEKCFTQAKKRREGILHWQPRIEEASEKLQKLDERLKLIQTATSMDQLPAIEEKERTRPLPQLPYREYLSSEGLPIWVGKSAKDNDLLTFRYANGSDWWFHVHHYPGSHVVLRVPKQQEPDEKSIKEAMLLAIAYSKAKTHGEAEVCITQCKYVKRAGKNSPGKVTISKHRLAHIRFDPLAFKKLKQK